MSSKNNLFKLLLLPFFFSFIVSQSLYSQKIKFKKDKIHVDKEAKYHFTNINNGNILDINNLPNCELTDIDGNKLLSFVDTSFYYVQLPNETSPRAGFKTLACINHSSGERSPIIMPQGFHFRKLIIQDLEDMGFFKGDMSVDDMYSNLLKKLNLDRMDKDMIVMVENMIEENNTKRISNYEITKEKYGDLVHRNPIDLKIFKESIKEDGKLLAKFKKDKSGAYAHIYKVFNHNNVQVASVPIFQKEPNYKVDIYALQSEESPTNFVTFQDAGGMTPETLDQKFYKIALYLVENGFL